MAVVQAHRRTRLLRTILILAVSATTVVPCAAAGGPPSAVAQYTESIPTASGHDTSQAKRAPVPKAVEHRIVAQGGSDSTVLQQIASEPTAPPVPTPRKPAAAKTPKKRSAAPVHVHAVNPAPVRPANLEPLAAGVGGTSALDATTLALAGAFLAAVVIATTIGARRRSRR